MASTGEGRPHILVRLEPEVFEKLREVAARPESGRGGGMAFLVRCLIHRHLGLPDPQPYAQQDGVRKLRRLAQEARGEAPKTRKKRGKPNP